MYIRLYSDMNMKREPWLPPCFMQVESSPEYRPIGPSVRMMCLMPSIGLMFRLISFVLIVSCGVTTAIDSVTPAASPARNAFPVETLPVVGSFSRLRKNWLPPKRMPAFGTEKTSVGVRPVYSVSTPDVCTVYRRPLSTPVYGGGLPAIFCIDCSCVLMYSIGQVADASHAPAMQPLTRESRVSLGMGPTCHAVQDRRVRSSRLVGGPRAPDQQALRRPMKLGRFL